MSAELTYIYGLYRVILLLYLLSPTIDFNNTEIPGKYKLIFTSLKSNNVFFDYEKVGFLPKYYEKYDNWWSVLY